MVKEMPPAGITAPEPLYSCPGKARNADLSRIYLPPLTSGTNSGLIDHGCSLEGLKKASSSTKNSVTETDLRDVQPLGFPPWPLGRPPGCRLALRQTGGALGGRLVAGALEGRRGPCAL